MTRVLGIDPGTLATGWGVVDCEGRNLRHVASGTIRVRRGDLSCRLGKIYEEIAAVLGRHGPAVVSLERNFLARNVQSAFRLGEARGVVMAAAAAAGVPLSEYTPATIKKAVAGHGRAGKQQVQEAVAALLGLSSWPEPDEADALAAAACHGLRSAYDAKIVEASPPRVGPRGNRRWTMKAVEALSKAAKAGRR